MQKSHKTGAVVGALAVVLAGSYFFANQVSAYRGDPNVKGPSYSEERHEAMLKAFANNDYEAWKELMNGRGRVTEVVTKENFSEFAKAHKLASEGKLDEAREVRQKLGLGMGYGRRGNGYRQNQDKPAGFYGQGRQMMQR